MKKNFRRVVVEHEHTKVFKNYVKDLFDYEKSKMIKRKHNAGQTYTPSHAEHQAATLQNHILPFFSAMKPTDITISLVDEWILYLKDKNLSNSSISHYISTLSVIVKEMLRAGVLEKNPLEYVDSFSKKAKAKDILTSDEMKRLFDISKIDTNWSGNKFYFTVCYLASKTGIRIGEAQALKKNAVKEVEIVIDKSWARHHGIKKPKNGKTRYIPISEDLRDLLLEVAESSDSDYVFSLPGRDNPVDHKIIYKYLYRAFEKIGISAEERKKRLLSFHNFRHYVNTKLIENGTPLPIVQAITGHSDLKMTYHYFHPNAENCREFLSQI
jgi:integrase/recombinase XerC